MWLTSTSVGRGSADAKACVRHTGRRVVPDFTEEPPAMSDPGRLLRLHEPAVADAVPRVRSRVRSFAARHSVPAAVASSLALAVTEACTNVVLHAYLERPEPGPLEVEAEVTEAEVVLSVSDEGRGMKPRPDSPGLGLGLPLIAQMTDRFEVLDRAERPGVCVRMHFELAAGGA
jgi:serine/threonine-protein kinase RsbW